MCVSFHCFKMMHRIRTLKIHTDWSSIG
jgi:hypothetical protein